MTVAGAIEWGQRLALRSGAVRKIYLFYFSGVIPKARAFTSGPRDLP